MKITAFLELLTYEKYKKHAVKRHSNFLNLTFLTHF
jgi:hypothetical protein